MDSVNAYGSGSSDNESDDGREPGLVKPVVRKYIVDTAPDVGGHMPASHELTGYVHPEQRQIMYNVPYEVLAQPPVGPADAEGSIGRNRSSLASGRAEAQAVDEERSFRQHGLASDPSIGAENRVVGNSAQQHRNNRGLRRKKKGDASILEGEGAYQGPWAGYEGETKGQTVGPTEEQLAEYEARVAEYTGEAPSESAHGTQTVKKSAKHTYVEGQEERTLFHGKSERDYQGRTYMHVPTELKQGEVGDQTCFVPKRMVKEWKAHAGGVSAIRFIPDSGHLLLSSGMDGLIKIYDTHSSLVHLRTYIGHSKAVRDIAFAPDGKSFLSSSYDKYTKLWDTETGKCMQRFSAGGKVPYVAKFYPEDPNIFLVGQGDKKIVQWDIRANEIVQEYDQHLGAINSLTFFDSNRRFISTSDDKSMRVWEFGIPVVIKLVADPSMHSVPAVALHPNEKWFVGQSMDNRVVVYSAGERIKPHRRKEFSGHLTAGFACQPSFSPDGKILTSGDAEGQ
ncbi:hypothetical protein GGI12_002048, partial [Dipsacomyces acuminosporus]